MIKAQIEADLKAAMLGGDRQKVDALRTIKSTILDAEVNSGQREKGLPENDVIALLQKEAKKRRETAQLYKEANDEIRAGKEEYEAELLATYLPQMMTQAELEVVVDEVLSSMGDVHVQQMGQVIGAVKAKVGPAGDGGIIANVVKSRLSK